MKTLVLLILVLASAGCTTLSNVGKMNRVMPQIEHLVLLRDKAVAGELETIELCGDDDYEEHLLVACAKQMGWESVGKIVRLDGKPIHCTGMVYKVSQ